MKLNCIPFVFPVVLAGLAAVSMAGVPMVANSKEREIRIPVVWEKPGGFILRLGFYEDDEKYIWAVESELFATVPDCEMFGCGFYINADNDVKTGRNGCDLQFTCFQKPRRYNFIRWEGERGIRLPAYPDDYRGELIGNVHYLTIKKSILQDHRIQPTHSVRFTLASSLQSHQAQMIRIDDATAAVDFFHYSFIGFHAQKGVRRKNGRAGVVYQQGETCIWDTWLDRFGPEEPIPDKRVKIDALKLGAAKGESESLQLCVTTPDPLESLEVISGDLAGPNGKRLPAAHIEVQYVGFATNGFDERVQDIVYPAFRPEKAKNNFVLLTVSVPRNQGAGTYRGSVRVRIDGNPGIDLPIELRIYDFSLPEIPSFKSSYCLNANSIGPFYNEQGQPRMTSTQIIAMYDRVLRLSDKYKVAPGNDPVRFWRLLEPVIEDGELKIDWTAFDRQAETFFRKYSVFRWVYFQAGSKGHMGTGFKNRKFLFPSGEANLNDRHFQEYWPEFVKQVCDHLKDKGWFDRMVFTIFDEPWESSYADIKLLSALAKKAVPDLPIALFIHHYEPKLAESIDTWIVQPPVGSLVEKKIEGFWIYNDPRVGSFISPASDIRSLYWMAFRYGMGGFLIWHTACWTEIHDGRVLSPHYILFHPADSRTGDPYASLRMTMVRDGIEDYEYLKLFKVRLNLARRRGHPGLANAEAVWRDVQHVMPQVTAKGGTDFPMDSIADLSALRNKMAEQIEVLSH